MRWWWRGADGGGGGGEVVMEARVGSGQGGEGELARRGIEGGLFGLVFGSDEFDRG